MTVADKTNPDSSAPSFQASDPRETGTQLRSGLWDTINLRYPGSMIRKNEFIPMASLSVPLKSAKISFVSSCGVHLKKDPPMDVSHPLGDFTFRRVPSSASHDDLVIHQLKYPHDDADLDINVIFPIERMQELVAGKIIDSLTPNFFSFVGYNMDPERFEKTLAQDISKAVVEEEHADAVLLAPA